MHYRERKRRSVEIFGRARNVTAWRQREWNFECPKRGAKRRGVMFGAVASIPLHLKSKSGASPPPILGSCFPIFGLNPGPSFLGSVLFLPFLHGPIRPFSFSFLCTSFSYALSPFPLLSLLPLSFLPLSFPEGPHTQLEGLASQVL